MELTLKDFVRIAERHMDGLVRENRRLQAEIEILKIQKKLLEEMSTPFVDVSED